MKPGENRHRLLTRLFSRNNVILLLLLIMVLTIHCPIKFLSGFSCPGCGMTRALLSLFAGNLKQALYYHPLVLLIIPAVLIYLFRQSIPKPVLFCFTAASIVLFLVVYLMRLFGNTGVVTADFSDGLLYRICLTYR